ncbi:MULTISPECIES: Lrp/AsnC family transcriptional regulator [Kitasatospora]|uniref:Lrp/AsnC family leucine-responsive transcriptional regulator n=2 Tax=Kitasatospora TaxID=2063 RepID=A0ABT1IVQ4_9ACTN|nr:Lrp/AsnC family transcriptional regulator [Kitasatospora paracochleata]MCP2309207.1 Lrp/AsnC family leucine-responsive transcriptional regulator [Kitasatospora paracochleata]
MTRHQSPYQLDDVDLALLRALRADGRTRASTLARRFCLSETAVGARLRRLAASGALTAVRAEIDPDILGRPLQAVVRVRYGPEPLDFDRLAARHPAVQSGLALAGEADLELQLACTDQRELHAVVAELRHAGPARVQVELVLRRLAPAPAPEAGYEHPSPDEPVRAAVRTPSGPVLSRSTPS